MRCALFAFLLVFASSLAHASEPANPWSGYGVSPGDPAYDRPIPAGWGGDATMVFSRNAPVGHNPNCCENVWRCYPLERKCFCDHGGCGPCRHGKHHGGAACSSGSCANAVAGELGGTQGDGSLSVSAPTAPPAGHAVSGSAGPLPVISSGAAPGAMVEPSRDPAAADASPLPNQLDMDEGHEASAAEPSVEEAAVEPEVLQDGVQGAEDSADRTEASNEEAPPQENAGAEAAEESATPESGVERLDSPVDDSPEPEVDQKDANVEESAKQIGPELFRVSKRPPMIQRIFRSR